MVCIETDNEYQSYLEIEKRELEELEKNGNELDDFLFDETEPEEAKNNDYAPYMR